MAQNARRSEMLADAETIVAPARRSSVEMDLSLRRDAPYARREQWLFSDGTIGPVQAVNDTQ